MYLFQNPVLQRELLLNLRTIRAFVLLFAYNAILAALVLVAWPQQRQIDLTSNNQQAATLLNLVFLGQLVLSAMMVPTFAAAAISGEKERKTYEMLLASPLRPTAIVTGKLLAALGHLALLIFSSLPIVMLCLPLGGVSFYEVLAAYIDLFGKVALFGMISVACSSYFKRTSSALLVSYLIILPLALLSVLFWVSLQNAAGVRLLLMVTLLPIVYAWAFLALLRNTSMRLLYPPDVGSEGQEVLDLEEENRKAVGMVLRRDQFPDYLFAPPKRSTFMPDTANPIYDKEMRSDIFAQGTLMLRLAIQIGMVVAIPLMAFCLILRPEYTPLFICYVLLFNVLVGPVFSANSVTSERERETLELLLTTTLTPWTILSGKLLAALRVSTVLTMLLLWPMLVAVVLQPIYWYNLPSLGAYVGIVLMTCLSTVSIGLLCSVLFQKTTNAMIVTYVVMITVFLLPLAINFLTAAFFPTTPMRPAIEALQVLSPFAATLNVPLAIDSNTAADLRGNVPMLIVWGTFTLAANILMLTVIAWLFNVRWRVAH